MDSEDLAKALNKAFPPEHQNFVTHAELKMSLDQMERLNSEKFRTLENHLGLKIQRSELVQRNWILSGVIATLLATGVGYVSLVTKLDRLEQGLPRLQAALDKQNSWTSQHDYINDLQDDELKKLSPNYQPLRERRE